MIALLQRALRAGFMRAEALFNRAFGDRSNPLYHLGAISFFLFWVVGATGLLLYAFFDTSVAGAYRSVEALTHGQWCAGGVAAQRAPLCLGRDGADDAGCTCCATSPSTACAAFAGSPGSPAWR